MRLAAELLPDPTREERYKFEPPIAKLYILVTRDSVLPQIIYASHCGIFKKESRAVARKPRHSAAVLFGLKYADDIHYKVKSIAKLRKPGFKAANMPAQNRI